MAEKPWITATRFINDMWQTQPHNSTLLSEEKPDKKETTCPRALHINQSSEVEIRNCEACEDCEDFEHITNEVSTF